jgi:toxin ParE1/3/4
MSECRLSQAAHYDLDDIWLYIGEDDPLAADRFIQKIVSKFPALASMPQMGRRREELTPGLRSFPVRDYIIFYRPIADGVEIIRVLLGAQDLPPLFE